MDIRRTHRSTVTWLALAMAGAIILTALPAAPARAQLVLEFKLTDKDVDKAMERLQNFLWMRQKDDGSWEDVVGAHYDRMTGGTTALVALALLEAGVGLSDERMERAIENLLTVKMDDTQSVALRVMALSRAYRLAQRKEFAGQIVHDLHWLTDNLPRAGAWGQRGPERTGSNTYSQYGLLALWESEYAGFNERRKVPRGVMDVEDGEETDVSELWPIAMRNLSRSWPMIEKTWLDRQRPDDGWTYAANAPADVESSLTMTAAGVASLYIVIDKAHAPYMVPGRPYPKARKAFDAAREGLDWFSEQLSPGFTSDGYLAFGVQRIAVASGRKYIGGHDWFRLGVKEIAERAADARVKIAGREHRAPHGADMQAAYYLIFLARGRVPVTFNKLERPGTDWDIAPRDIANLTRYLNIELEKRMAWQIVSVDKPVAEYLDSPILFLNGVQPISLKDETVGKMREYILRGGMIVGEATNNSAGFVKSFKTMLEKAFPESGAADGEAYKWKELPETHPILNELSDRDRGRVGDVWGMEDGTRLIAVLLTRDHATAWQQLDVVKKPWCFTIGRNLFRYATANEPLRTRLRPVFAGRVIEADKKHQIGIIHAGPRWLSDKYAVEQLSDKLATDARVSVELIQVKDPASLDPEQCPMIVIAGRGSWAMPEVLAKGLQAYVERGGLVVFNANMGDLVFGKVAKAQAKRIVPGGLPAPILKADPIMTGLVYRERGRTIEDPDIRYALRMAGVNEVELTGYRTGDRWGVIVSPHDIFMSMLGTPIYGNKGYGGGTAQQVAANLFLYALEQAETATENSK